MKVLYVGQYSQGTTSRMRGESLNAILNPSLFEIIDTHVPFYNTSRIFRTLGFRYKTGPLIHHTNTHILKQLNKGQYDLIWVDKAVYITPSTTAILRSHTSKMVHFTPDPAFTFHQSQHFYKSLPYYTDVITTKSYELDAYLKICQSAQVLYATQGFDAKLHQPSELPFNTKKGFVFIGHHETGREKILDLLLRHHIPITLAGIKWESFARRHINNPHLTFLGNGIFGEDYVKAIQSAKIAWGAISKWVPELHTTRTFEIPACGTALLTERNKETQLFFHEDEAIFYDSEGEIAEKVLHYLNNDVELEKLTERGHSRVWDHGYDYFSILTQLLAKILK